MTPAGGWGVFWLVVLGEVFFWVKLTTMWFQWKGLCYIYIYKYIYIYIVAMMLLKLNIYTVYIYIYCCHDAA